ncbi:recombinase family protein [Sinorhizobium meliloti]|nr:recombinase family protein [Sinorhizobium meliloti]WRQ69151.1 recombinase family protein [Sinorhizobium meliloti]
MSVPDQKRQGEAYCDTRGYQLVETFVEPGNSATKDRRPEFQRMIEAATAKPPAFDVVVVHSFSRFFRDEFEIEYYYRKLAKKGVKLVSITVFGLHLALVGAAIEPMFADIGGSGCDEPDRSPTGRKHCSTAPAIVRSPPR